MRLEGSLALLRDLLNGTWRPGDVLEVPPGHRVAGIYDWTEIIRAVPA